MTNPTQGFLGALLLLVAADRITGYCWPTGQKQITQWETQKAATCSPREKQRRVLSVMIIDGACCQHNSSSHAAVGYCEWTTQ